MRTRPLLIVGSLLLPLGWSLRALADPEPGTTDTAPAASVSASVSASAAPVASTVPPDATPSDPERKTSLEPKTAAPSPTVVRFVADPLSDTAVLAISFAWVGLSQGIISSGELRPQQPVKDAKLIAMDQWAVDRSFDDNASMRSNIVLYSAVGFALADPIWNGLAHNNAQVFLVDAFMYAEGVGITLALTNLAKIAVRRPRPRAYQEQQRLYDENPACASSSAAACDITETDSALSFVSGHASTVATISATATYLSWARAPKGSWKPWLTMSIGLAATAWVSMERVLSGAHFPTDVIAGAMIGYGVGILVPHIHREQTAKQRAVWIGYAPHRGGGVANLTLSF